jgi:hypothetical protein
MTPSMATPIANTVTQSTAVLESPYGFRNEVVIAYDGKQARTYSTTPITEVDVREMRDNIIRHQKMMDEYLQEAR